MLMKSATVKAQGLFQSIMRLGRRQESCRDMVVRREPVRVASYEVAYHPMEASNAIVSNTLTMGMYADLAPPLFSQYPLFVEFDRRRQLIDGWAKDAAKRLDDEPLQEVIDEIFANAEIYPLQLSWPKAWIFEEPADGGNCGNPPGMSYTLCVPIHGDLELLNLNPRTSSDFPDGEVFRGALVLTSFASELSEATQEFSVRIAQIQNLIELQRLQLEQFHDTLPDYIRAALRRSGLAHATLH